MPPAAPHLAFCGWGGRRGRRAADCRPLKTKVKAGYAAKTDRLDARRLADALRHDSVVGMYYPADGDSRGARALSDAGANCRAEREAERRGVEEAPHGLLIPPVSTHCLSNTAMLFTFCPLAFVPVVVSVRV